jgi:AcrR family transcriptional regulator
LFYARGVATTSVEEIAEASGLTKPTLYRHFPSKDALVGAYLDTRHEQLDTELRTWVEAAPPRKQPLAVLDWLCDWLSRPGFSGCAFVRTLAELPTDARVHARAKKRKRVLLETIETACRAAEVNDPAELAVQLALVIEGATSIAFVSGDAQAAIAAASGLGRLALAAAGLEAR